MGRSGKLRARRHPHNGYRIYLHEDLEAVLRVAESSNVRDQAELWAGHARTELEWAKSLSKRLAEGAYTMADDPGSWRTVP